MIDAVQQRRGGTEPYAAHTDRLANMVAKGELGLRIPVLAGIMLAMAAFATPTGRAEDTPDSPERQKYTVMAAFMYNFLSFVDWPPHETLDQGPILVGILGENPFGDAVHAIERKSVNGRPIEFRFFPDVHSIKPTHILFVSRKYARSMKAVRKSVAELPVLLVGEEPDFTRNGGMIRFYEVESDGASGGDRHLRIEINETAALASHLDIRSKLLRLASVVQYPVPESE